jgi:hypothetical protein
MFITAGASREQFERELAEWHQICREMDDVEAAALAKLAPGCCELTAYYLQQTTGLCCEVPLRITYHASCALGTYCCCWAPYDPAAKQNHRDALLGHHTAAINTYGLLTRLIVENLCVRPLTPWYIYHADISLIRPPKPNPPTDPCDCCFVCQRSCECQNTCSCERAVYLVNRRLRSLLCTFSGCHACHPASVLGPCPCCKWEDARSAPALFRQPSYAKAARYSPDAGCVCEGMAARLARWDSEYLEAREARTAAFYRRRRENGAVAIGLPVEPRPAVNVNMVEPRPAVAGDELPADFGGSTFRTESETSYVAFEEAPVGLILERDEDGASPQDCCSDRCQGLCVTTVGLGLCLSVVAYVVAAV